MTQAIETIAVIPAYNEASRVGLVVSAAFEAQRVDAVVMVDDGSSDTTLEAMRAAVPDTTRPFQVISHPHNLGKTETLSSGVNAAKAIGGATLGTLVFLDADSSPIWTRDTEQNMKLWQVGLNRITGHSAGVPSEVLEARQKPFIGLLAQYIDELVQPVAQGAELMRTGMYERNVVTDSFLKIFSKKGGHAGNRAIAVDVWDGLMKRCIERGVVLDRWGIEAALNEFVSDSDAGTFMMHGVVNVGSRVKAGGLGRGVVRMFRVHGQAPYTQSSIRDL